MPPSRSIWRRSRRRTDPHGVWSGGGTITLDGESFELPADPAMAVAIHPRKAATLVENAAAVYGEATGRGESFSGWASRVIETAWPRFVPHLMQKSFDELPAAAQMLSKTRKPESPNLLDTKLPHLDADRRVVAVMGLGRQREAIRDRRMMIEPLTKDRGPVAFRLFVPATDADALAEKMRGSCGGATRVCGKVESIEK